MLRYQILFSGNPKPVASATNLSSARDQLFKILQARVFYAESNNVISNWTRTCASIVDTQDQKCVYEIEVSTSWRN